MFYEFNENWRVINSSNVKINWNYIEKDFTQEKNNKLTAWYSYNIETEEFEKTPESIEFEKQQLAAIKNSLLKEIWELKKIKDWMELVWDDTTEITAKINDLISEYKSL